MRSHPDRSPHLPLPWPETVTHADGRATLGVIAKALEKLASPLWDGVIAAVQENEEGLRFLVPAYLTRLQGDAVWLMAGIHGEEPAGVNAIAAETARLAEFGESMPMVVAPLCNPAGYVRDWRYPNSQRAWAGESVSSAEHMLPDSNSLLPRIMEPEGDVAGEFMRFVLSAHDTHPPLVAIDLHEDEINEAAYVYVLGECAEAHLIVEDVLSRLASAGLPTARTGITRFGEAVQDGVVTGVRDGSIDEFLVTPEIMLRGLRTKKQAAALSIVVETPAKAPLETRIAAHRAVIRALPAYLAALTASR